MGLDVRERDADDRVVEEREEEDRADGRERGAAGMTLPEQRDRAHRAERYDLQTDGVLPCSETSLQRLASPTFHVPFWNTAVPVCLGSAAPPSLTM